MKVHVRYLELGQYDTAARFLDEHWARGHIYCRSQALFDWTFFGREVWDHPTYSFAVAESEGEVIGVLGAIPFELNSLGEKRPALWLANWMTRPEFRSSPASMMLLGKFRRPPFETIISFGINEAVARIYRIMRWQVLDDIPRHLLVLPEARGRMVRLLCAAHGDWSEERARALVDPFVLTAPPEESAELSSLNWEAWDEHDWPALAKERIGAVRDSRYLQWRYLEHPLFDYHVLSVEEGDRSGLLVWRLETIRQQTPQGMIDLERFGRLVEFLPASRENAASLMKAFLCQLREAEAVGADFYGFHSATGSILEELGMLRTSRAEEGSAMPSRFQPLEGKGGAIRSAITGVAAGPTLDSDEVCQWYWTKSDSDQDRPN